MDSRGLGVLLHGYYAYYIIITTYYYYYAACNLHWRAAWLSDLPRDEELLNNSKFQTQLSPLHQAELIPLFPVSDSVMMT